MSNRRAYGPVTAKASGAELAAAMLANEGLVHWTIRRQYLGRLPYQDAVQEGRIALWQALRGYKPDRGKFFWYALVAIRRGIWAAVAKVERETHEPLDGNESGGRADLAADLDQATDRAMARELVRRLPATLRLVIERRYGLDGQGERQFQEIGAELGVSKQRAQQLHVEALLDLADPATSTDLRRHAGRNEVRDYKAYLARRRDWQRRRRVRS